MRTIGRLSRPLLAGLLLGGCAMSPPPVTLGPLEPVVRAYSAHPVACAPTAVGNTIGGIAGYPVALALGLATWPALWALPEGGADATFQAYMYTLPYLGGLATGTVFVPVTWLLEERPCRMEFLLD